MRLAGEIRRTLLALAQGSSDWDAAQPLHVLGANSEQFARDLSSVLAAPVVAAPLNELLETPTDSSTSIDATALAPLAGLASLVAAGSAPPVDLLHPRRPPVGPSPTKTYVRAGVAAALVALAVGWQAYRNLQEPAEAAAAARAELAALRSHREDRAVDLSNAGAIQAWLDDSQNLLVALDELSQGFRQQSLSDASLAVDRDMAATRVTIAGRQATIAAAARSSDAIKGAEDRLRAAGYQVDRGPVDFASKALPEYPVGVTITASKPVATQNRAAEESP